MPYPEITTKELLPLIKAGEVLLKAYEAHSTVRALNPTTFIWSDAVVRMQLHDAEEAVVLELGKMGRGGRCNQLSDGPYVMTTEILIALDCFWAATCKPRFEEWARAAAAPADLARRVENLRNALRLLHDAAPPAAAQGGRDHGAGPTPRDGSLGAEWWDESRDNVKLTGWKDILQAIGVENSRSNQRKISRYQKRRGGPIGRVGRTSMADHGALVAWWSRIEQLGTSDGKARRNKGMAVEDFVKQDKSVHKEKRPNAKGRVR